MEKRTPHCRLSTVHAMLAQGLFRLAPTAVRTAALLGLDVQRMLTVVKALKPSDFYKSMTTYADHTVWQDVYKPLTEFGDLYIKITVIDDVLIVSFKESSP